MEKILFLTNYPSPYRVAFFDQLGTQSDLTVLFSEGAREQKHRDASWFEENQGHYRHVQLSKQKKLGTSVLCTDVISWLKKDYDSIILAGYSDPTVMLAIGWLRAHRVPFYMEVDGGLIRRDSSIRYWMKKKLVSAASGWFSSGQTTTDYLVHYGADRSRVWAYPFSSLTEADILARPVTPERKAELRRELGLEGEKTLLSIGQFIHRKGYDILLRAAVNLDPSAQIYIVGGEPTQEYLDLCQELGLSNIHFEGFMKKDRLKLYYQAADLFVLPTREDIWGLVVNEAMAYGLPVITTDRCVAGLELVEDGITGYIVPVEDVDALADRMNQALSQDLETMGARALERVRPYTIENMARVHMDILADRR